MNTYISGTLVRTTATFYNESGTATDPSTIELKYKLGTASVQAVVYPSSPMVRDGEGVYHLDIDTTGWAGPGNRLDLTEWIGTGEVQAIDSDSWEVEPPLL